MIKINKEKNKDYQNLFLEFEYFRNYIKFAFNDADVDIYVDKENNPSVALMEHGPICFICGKATDENAGKIFNKLKKGSWVVPQNGQWSIMLEQKYPNAEFYDRTLFDSSNLDLNHIMTMKKEPPKGFRIEPIKEKYLERGLIQGDVTRRFFPDDCFMEKGFGFALLDQFDNVHGFALTNFPYYDNEVELYFRVGTEDYQNYRRLGMGTTLCVYFIEECFKRGLDPVWDSAHEVSANIAKKFGYIPRKKWKMYHLI